MARVNDELLINTSQKNLTTEVLPVPLGCKHLYHVVTKTILCALLTAWGGGNIEGGAYVPVACPPLDTSLVCGWQKLLQ